MVRLFLSALTVAAVVGILVVVPARPAVADSPPVLEVLSPTGEAPEEGPVLITARLTGSEDEPVAGMTLAFYMLTDVFGERLMKVGEAMTDGTGTATLVYRPSWQGDHTLVVRFHGSGRHTAAQTTRHFEMQGEVPVHENAPFGLEPVRQWLPIAVGVAVLAVWLVMGLVAVRTFIGVPAAAGAQERPPVPAPVNPPYHPAPRPAPFAPVLAGLGVLVVVAGSLAFVVSGNRVGDLLSLPRGPQVSDPRPVKPPLDPAVPPPVDAPPLPLHATLVRLVPAMLFDPDGHLLPGSADLPAGVAVVDGRVLLLDSNRGRILKVTPDGKLAVIFETERGREASIYGATAMAARGEDLYIPSPDTGSIVVVSIAGRIEAIIRPELPPGQAPLRPAGIAVTGSGEIWLSDAANHRVLLLEEDGLFRSAIGQGVASLGGYGFNGPGGLTLDRFGNLWVVDTGNGQLKKYSPLGTFVQSIGEGRLSAPAAVAVDVAGNILVSDSRQMAVLSFAPDGSYLGSITSVAPQDAAAEVPLQSPHGLEPQDGLVYVMDRLVGLFVLRLEPGDALQGGTGSAGGHR